MPPPKRKKIPQTCHIHENNIRFCSPDPLRDSEFGKYGKAKREIA
jgi:hypothetical protein